MRQDRIRIWGLVSGFLWVLACGHSAFAEPQMNPEILELLKNSKPASSHCKQKEDQQKPERPKDTPVADIKPDLSCAILPIDLEHQRQSSNTALIDTRTAAEFSHFHIDGAMYINTAELRSKAFLREKLIVLIGNGKAEQQLYIDCKRLKSSGYKQVKVLWGGMPAWLASEYDVLGIAPNLAELTKLTASELWIESQFASNLILVAASQGTLQKQIKGALLMTDEKPKTIQSALKQRIKNPNYGALASVVLVASKDADVQAITQAIKPIPLLVYSDTPDAFVSQLTQQAGVWSVHERGPKQPKGCGR